jgi:hypothetical protein
MGSVFTALWLSLVFICELIWWAKVTIMSIVIAWQAGCMIHKTLDDLQKRHQAWVKVFELWCSFMATGGKFVVMPVSILIMTMAAVYNTVNPKPEDAGDAPDAPADAPAAAGTASGSIFDHFLKGLNLSPDPPAPAARTHRPNTNNPVRRMNGPVLPAAAQRNRANANVVAGGAKAVPVNSVAQEEVEAAFKNFMERRNANQPPAVNPVVHAAAPGSPPASNPNKKRDSPDHDEEVFVTEDGQELTLEEFDAMVEESKRMTAMIHGAKKRLCSAAAAAGASSP